jgi:hypothetical protein
MIFDTTVAKRKCSKPTFSLCTFPDRAPWHVSELETELQGNEVVVKIKLMTRAGKRTASFTVGQCRGWMDNTLSGTLRS